MELSYEEQKFKDIPEQEIRSEIILLGFMPLKITNTSGYEYRPHQHPETKMLVFLEGSMKVKVRDSTYECSKDDMLIIPGNTPHAAEVGQEGCVFFWSEKKIN